MFNSCRLSLRQKIASNEKWVEVELLKPYQATIAYQGSAVPEQMISAYAEGYIYTGRWRILSNSQTGTENDNSYTIGTSAPQQDKFWRFSVFNRQLQFVERHKVTGTGEYGSTETKVVVAVELDRAILHTNGIQPLGGARSASGTVKLGSNLLVPRHPLSWEDVPSFNR